MADGDDVGARDHDIRDADLVQREHIGQHLAFERREAGGLGDLLDRLLDILAQRAAAEAEQARAAGRAGLLCRILLAAALGSSVDAHSMPATRTA